MFRGFERERIATDAAADPFGVAILTGPMPAPPKDAVSQLATVVSSRPCGSDAVVLRLAPERPFEPLRASRFFMLRREDGTAPLIPRPYSVYRQGGGASSSTGEAPWVEFLIKVMGRGSRALEAAPIGSQLRLIGPLGNGWPVLDGDGAPWVMLAGGVGSAPFPMAIEQALRGMDGGAAVASRDLHFLFGARDRGLLYDLELFERLGVNVHTATVDGSHGMQGHVLQLLDALQAAGSIPKQIRVLACGPDPMLEAVHARAIEEEWDCWLSLETLMGCGVGICNGCPVPTREGGALAGWPNAKCCVEGPVFAARDIELVGH
ncbi:Dihydroorotate dehydrogenase B (NAD(+)), electron transfer subunit [Planctomycetes bacterium Pla163]|uniref:Dihydroorotate dehydrogenase B (NAD(+)), electron transfer subunit n=2 Tax=Rohdeia mirabilis TaxID=2528008 RepID=A0A518D3U6_9BACT|nr:Dihydroorotate dehydrogenase B (NAD(+)), electron transfer subunit [Planctomycetes bacterium Pla163]